MHYILKLNAKTNKNLHVNETTKERTVAFFLRKYCVKRLCLTPPEQAGIQPLYWMAEYPDPGQGRQPDWYNFNIPVFKK